MSASGVMSRVARIAASEAALSAPGGGGGDPGCSPGEDGEDTRDGRRGRNDDLARLSSNTTYGVAPFAASSSVMIICGSASWI